MDNNIEDLNADRSSEPLSEEVIDGITYIDGISQVPEINRYELDGVTIINGRVVFDDYNTFRKTLEFLGTQNRASMVEWGRQNGFESLLLLQDKLWTKIEAGHDIPDDILENQINIPLLSREDDYSMPHYSQAFASLVNRDGIYQIGKFVGCSLQGLSVWAEPEDLSELIDGISSKNLDGNDKLIVIERALFDEVQSRNWTYDFGCGFTSNWDSGILSENNPTSNRKLETRFSVRIYTQAGNYGKGTKHAEFEIETTSKKNSSRYRTNHYRSNDFTYTVLEDGVTNTYNVVRTSTETGKTETDTYYMYWSFGLLSDMENIVVTFTDSNPGNSGMTGTSASHRGMGNRYIRMDCD